MKLEKKNMNESEKNQFNIFFVMKRIVFFLLIFVVSINFGTLIGIGLGKLLMWLGIWPYLEQFFGWLVFID